MYDYETIKDSKSLFTKHSCSFASTNERK